MKMKFNRGFTLIELLVVIAIIGILSGVVLTSLNSARDKAKDASAKASMSSMRAEAEIAFDTAGSYSGVCAGALATLTSAVNAQTGNTAVCEDSATAWGSYTLLTDDSTIFCVDSTGYAGSASGTPIASGDYECN